MHETWQTTVYITFGRILMYLHCCWWQIAGTHDLSEDSLALFPLLEPKLGEDKSWVPLLIYPPERIVNTKSIKNLSLYVGDLCVISVILMLCYWWICREIEESFYILNCMQYAIIVGYIWSKKKKLSQVVDTWANKKGDSFLKLITDCNL